MARLSAILLKQQYWIADNVASNVAGNLAGNSVSNIVDLSTLFSTILLFNQPLGRVGNFLTAVAATSAPLCFCRTPGLCIEPGLCIQVQDVRITVTVRVQNIIHHQPWG